MAKKTTVDTKRLSETHIRELSVYYEKGGMNYWDYSQKPKGIYFSSMVYKQAEGDNFRSWTRGQQGDGYLLVTPLNNYSSKQLRLVVERVEEQAERIHELLSTEGNRDELLRVLQGIEPSLELGAAA